MQPGMVRPAGIPPQQQMTPQQAQQFQRPTMSAAQTRGTPINQQMMRPNMSVTPGASAVPGNMVRVAAPSSVVRDVVPSAQVRLHLCRGSLGKVGK